MSNRIVAGIQQASSSPSSQSTSQTQQVSATPTVNSHAELNILHAREMAQMMERRQQRVEQAMQTMSKLTSNLTNGLTNGPTNNLGATDLVRSSFLRFLLDGPRDIDSECGYPAWLTPDHYRAMYDREGVARRV